MKTILVPTDFSQSATNALDYAAALASQIKGKLLIAHIINIPLNPLGNGMVFPPDAQLEAEAKQELNKLAKNLRLENGYDFQVETILQFGYFLGNLNDLVKAETVDLVVIGTNGANNFLDKLVGTNTSQFVKMAACPVLAVPSAAKFTGIKNIAYASDFESEETNFLQQLFRIAEPLNAQACIINILTERQLNIFADNQVVREIMKKFPDNNYSIAQIQEDDVVAGINQFVQDNQPDILAVSIHDRGFIDNLFHISVSNKLVYHLTLPLLALPEKPYQKPAAIEKTQKQTW